ncbi:MAG: glycosyltransferase family 2 protein [Cyclobacteriaceae bacterium]
MTVSIITVVYNRKTTIERAIRSVLQQTYPSIEYLIVDGGSRDGTLEVIEAYRNKITKVISEKDKGMYDALNKGIQLATGDVIGVLHSDDIFYANDSIEKIAKEFILDYSLQCVYGDVAFINPNKGNKMTRYFSSANFSVDKFDRGFMPAHPSFFCRKICFEQFGTYKLNYDIAADFDLLVRFLKIHRIKSKYVPLCTTYMHTGGKSTTGIKSTLKINKEFLHILKTHGIKSNYIKLYSRYIQKVFEFI